MNLVNKMAFYSLKCFNIIMQLADTFKTWDALEGDLKYDSLNARSYNSLTLNCVQNLAKYSLQPNLAPRFDIISNSVSD